MSAYPGSMREAAQRQAQQQNGGIGGGGGATQHPMLQQQQQSSLVRAAAASRAASTSAATPFGRGNAVMGGLGVGQNGEPQQPMMSAQVPVSGTRGRRSDTIAAEQQALPGGGVRPRRPQERMLPGGAVTSGVGGGGNAGNNETSLAPATISTVQNTTSNSNGNSDASDSILYAPGGGRRMLLTCNSAHANSMETFNAIVARSTQPHPRLLDWSVEVVDINSQQLPPQTDAIIRQLRQMPQFQREIVESCVLFDRLKKIAYKESPHIQQVIQAQKDNFVAALVEQQQRPNGGGADQDGGERTAGGTASGRQGNLVRESLTNPTTSEKSIRMISRHSVLRGIDPAQLEDVARNEERRIRRDVGAGGGPGSISMRRAAGGTGGGMSGGAGDDIGSFVGGAAGGGEDEAGGAGGGNMGSMFQFQVKRTTA